MLQRLKSYRNEIVPEIQYRWSQFVYVMNEENWDEMCFCKRCEPRRYVRAYLWLFG